MDKLLFWLGLGAAQKGAGSKPTKPQHWVVSLLLGILFPVLITVGVRWLRLSEQNFRVDKWSLCRG